ncbi:hypothetical protein WR25_11865 [Diploscapter pachys]|uniref:Uncharacterized protein n=1 Tax=Diploscapter pachys TaxID=2018661 RepID=A0A2A2LNR1_9BILA|nr:hypothetical protein WR25_11865 [Diploscapter pachys]
MQQADEVGLVLRTSKGIATIILLNGSGYKQEFPTASDIEVEGGDFLTCTIGSDIITEIDELNHRIPKDCPVQVQVQGGIVQVSFNKFIFQQA